jgi:hypothetical protein
VIVVFNKKHPDETQIYLTDETWVIGFERKVAEDILEEAFFNFAEWKNQELYWEMVKSNGMLYAKKAFKDYMEESFDDWESFLIENNKEDEK